jgi:hypothetical protein
MVGYRIWTETNINDTLLYVLDYIPPFPKIMLNNMQFGAGK